MRGSSLPSYTSGRSQPGTRLDTPPNRAFATLPHRAGKMPLVTDENGEFAMSLENCSVVFQSPEESFTPVTTPGKARFRRSTSAIESDTEVCEGIW